MDIITSCLWFKVISTWHCLIKESLLISGSNNLTPQLGTPVRTHPTLVWVSSQMSHHLLVMRSGVTPHSRQRQHHTWELSQPSCKYPTKWAIILWWWDQVSLYISCWAGTALGIAHRAGTNFWPWCGKAVAYGNTAQRFHLHWALPNRPTFFTIL